MRGLLCAMQRAKSRSPVPRLPLAKLHKKPQINTVCTSTDSLTRLEYQFTLERPHNRYTWTPRSKKRGFHGVLMQQG